MQLDAEMKASVYGDTGRTLKSERREIVPAGRKKPRLLSSFILQAHYTGRPTKNSRPDSSKRVGSREIISFNSAPAGRRQQAVCSSAHLQRPAN